MRREHHGGQNARDWRRKIATLARRHKENVFTYKFRLDCDTPAIDFDAASKTYDLAEGIFRGSLIGLVCAVHLSGFRLFSRSTDTRQFRNASRYPKDGFANALQEHLRIENPRVSIPSIENVFAIPPRARDGHAPGWSVEDLTSRLYYTWENRLPGEDAIPETLGLATGIAKEVDANYDGWSALQDDVPGAMGLADDYLQGISGDFPRISALPPETELRPENATIAFDPDSPFVVMAGNDDIWLHQVVSVCAGRLAADDPTLDISTTGFATQLKNSVVGSQNNGLSWLFGRGLHYLRNHDAGQIAEDLLVPAENLNQVEQLKAHADAIPENPLFDKETYPDFRGTVGGKISSWISNYWKRLGELKELLGSPPTVNLPAGLYKPEFYSLFSGQHTDAAGLQQLCNALPGRISVAEGAIDTLMGTSMPGTAEIETIEQLIGEVSELIGQLAMLNNRIDQKIEHAEEEEDQKSFGELKVDVPKTLKEPPKLNRISGGTVNAAEELSRIEIQLNGAIAERRLHFGRYQAWLEDNGLNFDPMPVMKGREKKALSDRSMDISHAGDQAVRRLLHQIGGMSRRLSPSSAGFIRDQIAPLFRHKREANLYFHNRRGTLYRHPFSTSRHQAYEIDMERATGSDWLGLIEERTATLRQTLSESSDADPAVLTDMLILEQFVLTTRLAGLPDQVPGKLARPSATELELNPPALLNRQLAETEVDRDVAIRTFNLYNSAINGLLFRALRESFIVRTRFQRMDVDELLYVPKERPWTPPSDYERARGEISSGLKLAAVKRNAAGEIDPAKLAEGLSKERFPEPGARALLSQSPHDWFLELDLRAGGASNRDGIPVKKNGTNLKRWQSTNGPAFRLRGPPSFKSWLDRCLTSRDIKMGDYTLILDQGYSQSFGLDGESIKLRAVRTELRAEAAIPIIDGRSIAEGDTNALFDRVVAIDLGERRVGYAVFSLVDLLENGVLDPVTNEHGQPLVGSVAIPAFRRLMAAVRRHRGSRQPNQKIQQSYSPALMQFRENVIGDVCNRIDTLCHQYGAFPILESSVANFETGAQQLKLIYGSVLRRYTYSNVQAHKAARREYWYTGEHWDHPYLHVYQFDEKEKKFTGRSKPLITFPGVAVNPAGTSQICHQCQRNPLTALRQFDVNVNRLAVSPGGQIKMGDGTIKLMEKSEYSPEELRKFRHQKTRPPLNLPVEAGKHRRSFLETVLRRNMRQAPRSEMSPDTTQARFTCVYTDCGYEGHADENAAVNIGRRFIERIDVKQSIEAHQLALAPKKT